MRAACWPLARLGVYESLTGDSIEQHRAGRSVAWIWLQSLAAIAAAMALDIRRRPVRAALAVVLGLTLREAHKALWSLLWHYTNPEVANFLPVGFVPLSVALSWTNLLMAVPGWIVMGWLHARLNGATLVFPYVVVSWMLIAPDLWRQARNSIGGCPVPALFLHRDRSRNAVRHRCACRSAVVEEEGCYSRKLICLFG